MTWEEFCRPYNPTTFQHWLALFDAWTKRNGGVIR